MAQARKGAEHHLILTDCRIVKLIRFTAVNYLHTAVFSILTIAALVSAIVPQVYADSYPSSYLMSGPVLRNVTGDELEQVKPGQQTVLEFTLKKLYERGFGDSAIAITEVRDANGFTVFLAWQTINIKLGEIGSTSVSWTMPTDDQAVDVYEVRFFVISSIEKPEALSTIADGLVKVT